MNILSSLVCRPFPTLREVGIVRLPSSSAFTLIELLVVMVIAAVIMAVSLPSFMSMGRGMGMRTAVNNVRSTLALSRQWAITHREQITFVASTTGLVYNMTNDPPDISKTTNDHACYYAYSIDQENAKTSLVQSITDLPLDVTFGDPSVSETNLTFKTDGGLTVGITTLKIVLVDKKSLIATPGSPIKTTISITGLTGGIKVE